MGNKFTPHHKASHFSVGTSWKKFQGYTAKPRAAIIGSSFTTKDELDCGAGFICKENKIRLDKFLVKNLHDFSRSKIQKLIRNEGVKVNDSIVKVKHYWLRNGDRVIIAPPPSPSPPTPLPQRRRGEFSFSNNIKIIKETKNYLVLEKPAGLMVHPAENVKEYTLVDWLKEKYPEIENVGDDKINRPGIIHRLDKNVSGLLVITRTQEMFKHLKKQFKDRTVRKKYLALVYDKIKDNEGKINFPIIRSKRTGKMVAKPIGVFLKKALTLWTLKKQFDHYSLLDIEIKTGRSHQIRAHMQAIDHSVVGDNLYKNKEHKDKFNLNRIFLHAYYLEFTDLQGERQKFEIELPEELQEVLRKLGN